MKKKIYIATFIEVTESGDIFSVILNGDTPEKTMEDLKATLQTETNERGIGFSINESLLDDITYGNETSGPTFIPARNTGSDFYLSCKTVEITIDEDSPVYAIFNKYDVRMQQFGIFTSESNAYNVVRKASETYPGMGYKVGRIK